MYSKTYYNELYLNKYNALLNIKFNDINWLNTFKNKLLINIGKNNDINILNIFKDELLFNIKKWIVMIHKMHLKIIYFLIQNKYLNIRETINCLLVLSDIQTTLLPNFKIKNNWSNL